MPSRRASGRPLGPARGSRIDGLSTSCAIASPSLEASSSNAAFDARDYGHGKLGELVRAQPYVEVKNERGPSGLNTLWVRLNGARAR